MEGCCLSPRRRKKAEEGPGAGAAEDSEEEGPDPDAAPPIQFLSAKHKALIVRSWNSKVEDPGSLGAGVLRRVLAERPELRRSFGLPEAEAEEALEDQAAFARHSLVLGTFLGSLVARIAANDAPKLHTLCWWAGRRHAQLVNRNLHEELFRVFHVAILAALEEDAGVSSKAALDAWNRALHHVLAVISTAFQDAYQDRLTKRRATLQRSSRGSVDGEILRLRRQSSEEAVTTPPIHRRSVRSARESSSSPLHTVSEDSRSLLGPGAASKGLLSAARSAPRLLPVARKTSLEGRLSQALAPDRRSRKASGYNFFAFTTTSTASESGRRGTGERSRGASEDLGRAASASPAVSQPSTPRRRKSSNAHRLLAKVSSSLRRKPPCD